VRELLLWATILASRFLEIRTLSIADELEQLPESLREWIIEQMREFAGAGQTTDRTCLGIRLKSDLPRRTG